jgi:hypothetical protein
MRRAPLITLGVLVLLLAAAQVALPSLAERKVEDRVERNGGDARVSVAALPAARLLFGDGDSLEVRGSGLRVDVGRRERVLERLDGFDRVDVRLTRVEADPLEVSSFVLERAEGEDGYRVRMSAETSPRDVAGFLGSQAGGLLGGVLGDLAAGGLPGGGEERVPLDIRADVESRDGNVAVTSSSGSVAGVPAGPLAEIVVEAVARQL